MPAILRQAVAGKRPSRPFRPPKQGDSKRARLPLLWNGSSQGLLSPSIETHLKQSMAHPAKHTQIVLVIDRKAMLQIKFGSLTSLAFKTSRLLGRFCSRYKITLTSNNKKASIRDSFINKEFLCQEKILAIATRKCRSSRSTKASYFCIKQTISHVNVNFSSRAIWHPVIELARARFANSSNFDVEKNRNYLGIWSSTSLEEGEDGERKADDSRIPYVHASAIQRHSFPVESHPCRR